MKRQDFKMVIELIEAVRERDIRFAKSMESVLDGQFVPKLSIDFYRVCKVFFTSIFGADDAETIEWWMCENDFGKAGMKMWDGQDKEIPMRTTDDLFDYLTFNSP